MRKPDTDKVEVDMVPLIDIISLLLMFLIIVGDQTASSNSVKMKLPEVQVAFEESRWAPSENRIVIQMVPVDAAKPDGVYAALFNGTSHGNTESQRGSLKEHLTTYIHDEVQHGRAQQRPDHTLDIPVKLRIPADCPMTETEKVLHTIASQGLVDVQFAAAPKPAR